MMKVGLGTFLIVTLLWLWSCEENPVEFPLEQATLVQDTLYATMDTTFRVPRIITTLASQRLLLGELAGFKFRIIMRFAGFPAAAATIDSAWIRFTTLEASGEMPVEFTATGYPILQSWIADTSEVWKDYNSNVDFSDPMGEMTVTTGRNDTVFFHFNSSGMTRVNNWADTSSGVDNFGMALDFSAANFVKEFQARNSSDNIGPFLFIQYRDSTDSVMVDSLLAISDAFLFEGDFQPIPGRNQVTTLRPRATLLRFNLDTLQQIYPEGIIVESVNLEMGIDWANTLFHQDFKANLEILPLTSSLTDSNITVDSAFVGQETRLVDFSHFNSDSSLLQVSTGGDRQQLARFFVQSMLNNPDLYQGFYIDFKNANQFLSRFTFFRYNDSDPSKRPRLIIQSLKLPEERL